jgi:hypothetical protein
LASSILLLTGHPRDVTKTELDTSFWWGRDPILVQKGRQAAAVIGHPHLGQMSFPSIS